jgi:hypothetical protein
MRYVIHNKTTGEILRQGVVPDGSDWHQLQVQAEHEAVLLPPKGVPVDDGKHQVDLASGTIVAKPAPSAQALADQATIALRRRRDALLAAADHTQFAHVPMAPDRRAAWADYMQALRDLPATTSDPANPVWPQPPQKD